MGDVYSMKKDQFCKARKNRYGQMEVSLFWIDQVQTIYVAKLVATFFVPNPYDYTYIRHKDGDKSNCKASNLEWWAGPNVNLVKIANWLEAQPRGHYTYAEVRSALCLHNKVLSKLRPRLNEPDVTEAFETIGVTVIEHSNPSGYPRLIFLKQ